MQPGYKRALHCECHSRHCFGQSVLASARHPLCSALLCSALPVFSFSWVFFGVWRSVLFSRFAPRCFFLGAGTCALRVQAGFGLAVWSCRFSRPLPRDSTTIQERPGEPLYDSLSCPFAVLLGCSVTQHLSRDSDTVTRHTARPGDQLRSAHTFTILLVRHFATCSAGGEGPPKTPLHQPTQQLAWSQRGSFV